MGLQEGGIAWLVQSQRILAQVISGLCPFEKKSTQPYKPK
jgi:hypothetical protein